MNAAIASREGGSRRRSRHNAHLGVDYLKEAAARTSSGDASA
ncbi:hypothetical protein ACFOQM_05075 [Paenibacillus sp. GCM10012307]|nr:hypothetical protein [Paenibacillus roseus]